MRIYQTVRLQGARTAVTRNALIDTGAEVSMIPADLAAEIGAWLTFCEMSVVGVHGDSRRLEVIEANLWFPLLDNGGGRSLFVVGDGELIVGIDVLRPLGITIDTGTGQLAVKNAVWEAFKTVTGVGALVFGGIKVLEALSDEPPPRRRPGSRPRRRPALRG